jgi:hypothetical protein
MSETTFAPRPESEVESLRSEVQSLRAVVSFSVLLLFIFTVCVNIYLFRQANLASGQVAQARAAVANFENGGGAQIVDFWSKLNDYSRTHPDFQPIINKYDPFFRAHMKKK